MADVFLLLRQTWILSLVQAIRGLGGEDDFAEHLLWMSHSSGHLIDSLLCQSIFLSLFLTSWVHPMAIINVVLSIVK